MGAGEPAPRRLASPTAPTPSHPVPASRRSRCGILISSREPSAPPQLEAEFRPEPEPFLPKENLQAIVSILAVGVLRRRARNGASPGDVGRTEKNLQI